MIIGDDDSGTNGGQVFLYVGNVGDLENGEFYMLKRSDDNQRERDIVIGQSYDVEFVKVENHKSLTGAQINAKVDELKGLKFGRVEDLDYRKGGKANSREIYFNVTGQNNTGANADYSRTKFGRVYKLMLDAASPLKGKLSVILDGDDANGPAKEFQNVDNIYVGQNYLYTQEDPNGYGDNSGGVGNNIAGTTHDSYIYQYNLATGQLKKVLELDHRRNEPDAAKYNAAPPAGGGDPEPSDYGSWEYGAMEDISDLTGLPNTFAICIQPHTWVGPQYAGVDGGTKRRNENQASQVIIVKGLPR